MAKLTVEIEDQVNERLKFLASRSGTKVVPLLRAAAETLAGNVEIRNDGSFALAATPNSSVDVGKGGTPLGVHTSTSTRADSKDAYWHDLLDAVLTSGNESAATAIQRNLEVLAFTGSLTGQQGGEEFRKILGNFMRTRTRVEGTDRKTVRHKKAG